MLNRPCWTRPGGSTDPGCARWSPTLRTPSTLTALTRRAQRRDERRGVWFTTTIDRMVAVRGIMPPEAGQTLITALEPLARPADPHDTRSGGQRTADALTELARRELEDGQLPDHRWGPAPAAASSSTCPASTSLDGQPERAAGQDRWGDRLGRTPGTRGLSAAGLWDATLTGSWSAASPWMPVTAAPPTTPRTRSASEAYKDCLQAVMARLPSVLGGAPSRPRTSAGATRVISPAERQRPGRPRRRLSLPRLPPPPGLV